MRVIARTEIRGLICEAQENDGWVEFVARGSGWFITKHNTEGLWVVGWSKFVEYIDNLGIDATPPVHPQLFE